MSTRKIEKSCLKWKSRPLPLRPPPPPTLPYALPYTSLRPPRSQIPHYGTRHSPTPLYASQPPLPLRLDSPNISPCTPLHSPTLPYVPPTPHYVVPTLPYTPLRSPTPPAPRLHSNTHALPYPHLRPTTLPQTHPQHHLVLPLRSPCASLRATPTLPYACLR